MSMPDWVALHSYRMLADEPVWPWDDKPADDGPSAAVVAAAQAYQLQHSALREP